MGTACEGSRLQVNAPPAETWNYLNVNGTTLEMPRPRSAGEVYARLPRAFSGVEVGIGAEATAWVEKASGDARLVEVRRDEADAAPITVAVHAGEYVDLGVIVREAASATIVVLAADRLADRDPLERSSATLLRIIAERGANVSVIETVATRAGRTHLGGIGITADEEASVNVRQYAVGLGTTALGIATNLVGSSSRLDHAMRYLVEGGSSLDANHVARLRGRATRADVSTSGVLAEGARKTLRETIDLVRGARGAHGNEAETVLAAGEHIVNRTLPTILCDEEDVAGNHGASIGAISADQLCYLADRGLSEGDAEALFVRAVFDDALAHARACEARAAIMARATDVLGGDVAADMADMLDVMGR